LANAFPGAFTNLPVMKINDVTVWKIRFALMFYGWKTRPCVEQKLFLFSAAESNTIEVTPLPMADIPHKLANIGNCSCVNTVQYQI